MKTSYWVIREFSKSFVQIVGKDGSVLRGFAGKDALTQAEEHLKTISKPRERDDHEGEQSATGWQYE